MATMETMQQEISALRKDVELLKEIVKEDYELSDEARAALEEARKAPKSEYADLDDI